MKYANARYLYCSKLHSSELSIVQNCTDDNSKSYYITAALIGI
jgi:hypothetical protein